MSNKPLFKLGQTLATPGASEAMETTGDNPAHYLSRHVTGDWGEVCEEDKAANDADLANGRRLLSAYTLSDGETKIWTITEWDRSATTILLPSEY